MALTQLPSNALAADANSLQALKRSAGTDSKAAIKETARQLESLFMRELIKSMRDATMKSGLTESPEGNLGTDLLDQQLSVAMSGLPGGLSTVIEQQLTRQTSATQASPSALAPGVGATGSSKLANNAIAAYTTPSGQPTSTQNSFVQKLSGAANAVEKDSGIPASYMLGQAGHESGWGKHEIRNADGSPSFNLFGIKAGPGWKGKVAEVTTTEYVGGQPQTVKAKFRAYDSYEQSFRDYAHMITGSARYAQVAQLTASPQAFASGLQRAGYATDPQYAAKLTRAIQTTVQVQRAQA